MSKEVIAILRKKLKKYDINLKDIEIKKLGVCGVIDLIIRQEA